MFGVFARRLVRYLNDKVQQSKNLLTLPPSFTSPPLPRPPVFALSKASSPPPPDPPLEFFLCLEDANRVPNGVVLVRLRTFLTSPAAQQ